MSLSFTSLQRWLQSFLKPRSFVSDIWHGSKWYQASFFTVSMWKFLGRCGVILVPFSSEIFVEGEQLDIRPWWWACRHLERVSHPPHLDDPATKKKSTETVVWQCPLKEKLWNIHDLIISIISFKLAKSSQRKKSLKSQSNFWKVWNLNKLIFFHDHSFSHIRQNFHSWKLWPKQYPSTHPFEKYAREMGNDKKTFEFPPRFRFVPSPFFSWWYVSGEHPKQGFRKWRLGWKIQYHPKISTVLQLRHQRLWEPGEEGKKFLVNHFSRVVFLGGEGTNTKKWFLPFLQVEKSV